MTRYPPQLGTEQIYIETSEYAITGTITLPDVHRVSDALNNRDRDFLALADALTISKVDGSEASHSFLAVARQHVVLAFSLSDKDVPDEKRVWSGPTARLRGRAISARLNGDRTPVSG
jgi:hypothetical protein